MYNTSTRPNIPPWLNKAATITCDRLMIANSQ